MSLVLDILSFRQLWGIQVGMSTGHFLIYESRAPGRCQGRRFRFGKHRYMDDGTNHQRGWDYLEKRCTERTGEGQRWKPGGPSLFKGQTEERIPEMVLVLGFVLGTVGLNEKPQHSSLNLSFLEFSQTILWLTWLGIWTNFRTAYFQLLI